MEKNRKIIPFLRGPFSQWHPSEFKLKGVTYNCCEQYMMAQKALLFGDVEMYNQIIKTKSPARQKALGRKVKGFDIKIWKKHRYNIVLEGNRAKFSQKPHMRDKLLATGDAILCETNPRDAIWGIALKSHDPRVQDPTKWKGLNLLGTALMEVREELQ